MRSRRASRREIVVAEVWSRGFSMAGGAACMWLIMLFMGLYCVCLGLHCLGIGVAGTLDELSFGAMRG